MYRTVTRPSHVVSFSLSPSRPFHNKTLCPQPQHSLTTTSLSHHRSSALQTLTLPLIFCPSLLHLHCVRSLRYQEGWRCFQRFPSPPSSRTLETHTKESQTPNSEHNPGIPHCSSFSPLTCKPIAALWVCWREICEPSIGMILFLTVFMILSIYFINFFTSDLVNLSWTMKCCEYEVGFENFYVRFSLIWRL